MATLIFFCVLQVLIHRRLWIYLGFWLKKVAKKFGGYGQMA